MKYKISAPHPSNRLLEIEMTIDKLEGEELMVHLPAWRPGRYELGNFAKNIRKFEVFDERDRSLPFRKVGKDSWRIKSNQSEKIVIKYNYYAAQADAGSCWVDEEQVYLNPVHCLIYLQERMSEPCELHLSLPAGFQIATSLKKLSERVFSASDYHELVDSPLIASASLQHQSFSTNGVAFNIWIQGDCEPQWERIIHDFRRFSQEQVVTMGDFPANEYHFLIQMLPYKFYHGVEHLKSTVIALGPGSSLMENATYTDFLGIASHELFHSWNIKTIRPIEMMPYNYSRENYSRLGFVYEGVTSYYGDLFLARCGVYSANQFFMELNMRLQRHFDSAGRHNLSVADSSYDTWIDGYIPGIPGRKVSIYDKGCIAALMTDLLIRKHSNSRYSLDDVMKTLYNDFGKKKIGYTDLDYMTIIQNVVGEKMTDFFVDYIYGTEDDESLLSEVLSLVGCELVKKNNPISFERYYGFRITKDQSSPVISQVWPGSVADQFGLSKDDEIIAVNDKKIEGNLDELLLQLAKKKTVITVCSPMKKIRHVPLTTSAQNYYPVYSIRKKEKASGEEQRFFKGWIKQEFY